MHAGLYNVEAKWKFVNHVQLNKNDYIGKKKRTTHNKHVEAAIVKTHDTAFTKCFTHS